MNESAYFPRTGRRPRVFYTQEEMVKADYEIEPQQVDIRLLDLRVGCVVEIEKLHLSKEPYVILDIGNDRTKTAALDRFLYRNMDPWTLMDKNVVICLNLSPTSREDATYNSRVLAAVVRDGGLELLRLPDEAEPGDRVICKPFSYLEKTYRMVKPAQGDRIREDLRMNEDKTATYKDIPLRHEGSDGRVFTDELADCPIRFLEKKARGT